MCSELRQHPHRLEISQRLRVYDKSLESTGEIIATRREAQLRDETALTMVAALLAAGGCVGSAIRTWFVSLVDFHEDTGQSRTGGGLPRCTSRSRKESNGHRAICPVGAEAIRRPVRVLPFDARAEHRGHLAQAERRGDRGLDDGGQAAVAAE